VVAAAPALARDVAGGSELNDDAVRGPLGDPNAVADLAQPARARGGPGGFGLGFLGAALLAACVVPLSTAYSVAEAFRRPCDLNDSFADARLFYVAYGGVVAFAAAIVLIPGAPLVSILFLSQALNAVLLLLILPFMRRLAQDPAVMGDHALGLAGKLTTGIPLALVAASVTALAVLSVA
jgi:Mn2+/Fe2+ NRAMP family transporter